MKNAALQSVIPANQMRGDSPKDTRLLREMLRDASSFMSSFQWCSGINKEYFGLGIGGVVAVFLFKILPKSKNVDEWLWVVVGDLPPAYLVTDDCPTPAAALEGYIEAMNRWVSAAKAGEPVDDRIPVNAAPSPRAAELLQKRLDFLAKKIAPLYP